MVEEAKCIMDRFSSKCSACGGNADPNEDAHIHGGPKSMYDPDSALSQTNGCGAKFTEKVDAYA